MKITLLRFAVFASLAAQPLSAQLPSLDDQPWLGFFAGYENKRFKIGLSSVGKVVLTPMNEKGDPVSQQLKIAVDVGVEEILPNGKTTLRQIKPETLESAETATDKLEKTTIRGKVTGDAAFEMHLSQERGVISIGGRVTDPGTLTRNPTRFVVRVRFPSAYYNQKTGDKKAEKEFQKKIEDDRIDLKWTDGKKVKQTFEKEVDASAKELNGPGIAAAQVEISAYRGHKFLLIASENSSMTLWNAKPGPLHTGFSVNWTADTEKDKEGKARLSIDVK